MLPWRGQNCDGEWPENLVIDGGGWLAAGILRVYVNLFIYLFIYFSQVDNRKK